uniref:Uncharacterized protein n=1 Tax=Tanacetum cinerariifolium TaxID=118510 RepID=A0A6L2MDC4_TANCI|nr:hypothetical protein [Tanacetum cinerariifolium]
MESLNSNSREREREKEREREERERAASVATNARQNKGKLHGIFLTTSFTSPVLSYNELKITRWVNEIQMKSKEGKVDSSKALDADFVVTESSGTKSEKHDTSSKSKNDTHAEDADIKPVNDTDPMAEAPFLKEKKGVCFSALYLQKKRNLLDFNHSHQHFSYFPMLVSSLSGSTSGPGLHSMTPATSSSGLVPNTISQQPCIPPNRDDWNHLFKPMFDEYFNPPSIAVSPVPVAAAPIAADLADSPVSTSIDQNYPSTKHQSDTKVFTMTMEILLEPISNKLLVDGNPVKKILLKLNLPNHRSILMDSKEYIKMDVDVPGFGRLTRFIATCSYSIDIYKDIMKVQVISIYGKNQNRCYLLHDDINDLPEFIVILLGKSGFRNDNEEYEWCDQNKKYAELSAAEKIQADCDMKATNIILQGLPADIYSLVNHHRTEDLDTYDSDCDDISNAQAILMANISNYGSDIISEVSHSETYLNDMENQKIIDKKISHKSIDFKKLNRLSEDFGKRFTPQQEMDAEEAFWLRISNPTSTPFDASPVKIEAPKELSKVSLVNESLKKLKFHLARFGNVVKIRTTPDARTEGKEIIDITAQKPSANTIVSGMFKLDLEPLAPRNMKNKVEAQPRNVNKKNRIVETIRNVDVKQSQLNANSELICATCNGYQQKDKNEAKTDKNEQEMEKHGKVKVKVNQKVNLVKVKDEADIKEMLNGPTRTHLMGRFRIQQYLQNEQYALWEVIEFGDSYKAPPKETGKGPTSESFVKKKGRTVAITIEDMQNRRNDVKARTTLLLSLPDEHQLRFSKYETAKELWEAILKTFAGNEATKKTKKNQLKL